MRNADGDPFGKLVERIELHVSEPLKNGLTALAAARGLTVSQFVRRICNREVFGELSILRTMYRTEGPPTIGGIEGKSRVFREGDDE